ncbi:MAG TPA: AAA family ATPase [Candidatus Obscuribacterales bacterium]
MSITLLLIAIALLFGFNALFHFNARFRGTFFRTAWKLKFFVIVPVALWLLLNMLLGAQGASQAMPIIITLVFTLIQVVIFSLFNIFIMFWAMGRPQVDWYYPGDVADDLDWDHWIGSESVKVEAQKMVESLRNWALYEKNGTKPANGALFYGPPGTGKSLLAKVIAAKANLPVAICASASLNGPFVAMGMLIVKALARKIRKNAEEYGGCVVFLDEIDAIGTTRGGVGGMGLMGGMGMMGGMGGNGTLQTLLTEMSGATNGETWTLKLRKRWGLAKRTEKKVWRILWIAATNMELDRLDPALIRSGRFGSIKLYIGNPNDDSRRGLFRFYLRKKTLARDIDHEQLVQLSRGMTGADIEEVCEAAARSVIFEGRETVTFEDLWRQIRFKKFGAPRPVPLHEEERWPIAVHESGHGAAVVHFPPNGFLCSGATLRPTEEFLGAVMFEAVEERNLMMEEDTFRRIFIAVASRAAEEVVLNDRSAGVSSDLNQAMSTALAMVEHYGMGKRLTSTLAVGGGHTPAAVKEAEDIVNATFVLARRFIAENRAAVEALSHALVEKIDLTGPEVISIVKDNGTPSFTSVKDEVGKILVQMREEEKREKSRETAASASDFPAPANPDSGSTSGGTFHDRIAV